MKACAIPNVFIYTANTLLVKFAISIFCIRATTRFGLSRSKNNNIVALYKKTLFLSKLYYPIRNWFSEIRKVNSVVNALKFQQQKLLAPEETAFSSL